MSAPQPLDYQRQPGPRLPRAAWIWTIFVGLLVAVVVFLALPALNDPDGRRTPPKIECASHLRQIQTAALLWAHDHGGRFPDSLAPLIKEEEIGSEVFVCPLSKTESIASGRSEDEWRNELLDPKTSMDTHCSYIWVGAGKTPSDDPNTILAYEWQPNHDRGINVVYLDGHVKCLPPSQFKLPVPIATTRPSARSEYGLRSK